ncbi:MAG TPA: hypothetical protein VLJ42_11680 [Solirubrobacteraceae bacterium]|nr:hypothetical protein [Solirubrobacteraceae bacterium]
MLLTPAVTFYSFVLGLHIAAVVIGFGVTFAYPIIFTIVGKQDPRALPVLHRAELFIGQRLISPALGIIVVAGIYLASKLDAWSSFYVQWGFGAAIVLGALAGVFFAPTERRLVELSERDVAAAPASGEVVLSAEYNALSKRLAMVGSLTSLLVLVTIFVMATHLGA